MQNRISQFYNRIAFLYPLVNVFLVRQRAALINEVNAMPAGSLLDIGVGNGSHLPLYKNHHITGIDISEGMLRKAFRHSSHHICLELMNGEELTYPDESFDYVVMSHVLAVTGDPQRLLEQASRVLRPGGRILIINHFTPRNLLGLVDRLFHPISSRLHFRSRFYLHEQEGLQQFVPLKQKSFGPGSYFKLIILAKP